MFSIFMLADKTVITVAAQADRMETQCSADLLLEWLRVVAVRLMFV
jgi:hypothetical protein